MGSPPTHRPAIRTRGGTLRPHQKGVQEFKLLSTGDLYHHYVNGDRKVTVLLTRWETLRDADQFRENLRGGGKTVYRLGANILVLAGDLDGRGDAVAVQAAQGLRYWAGE